MANKYDILVLRPQKQNIYFIVNDRASSDDIHKDDYDNNKYFYNEHTCPTNWINNVDFIIDQNSLSADPHGLFEYVKSVKLEKELDIDDCGINQLVQNLNFDFNE